MSDTPQGQAPSTGAPATPPTPPAVPPPPVIPPTPSQGAAKPAVAFETQEAFNERMARARASYAKDLGLTGDPAQDKARLAQLAALEEAQKTEQQRTTDALAAAKAAEVEHVRYQAVVKSRAEHELSRLNETQRAAVTKAAGDDPARQLEVITAFAPTWTETANSEETGASTEAGAAAAKTGAKPPIPQAPPASSIARPNAPPPAGSQATSSKLATYQHLQRANPRRAAVFLTNNFAAITAERKAASTPS